MKTIILLFAITFILYSCSTTNRILTNNDPFKNEQTVKLIQNLDGYSDEKKGWFIDRPDYSLQVKTVYTRPLAGKSGLRLELRLTTAIRPEVLDSVIYLSIDNEVYPLQSMGFSMRNFQYRSVSTQTTSSSTIEKPRAENNNGDKNKEKITTSVSTSTSETEETRQVMKHTFDVPPMLWNQLTHCENVMIRVYIEKEVIDIPFGSRKRKMIEKFFTKVTAIENNSMVSVRTPL